MLAEKFAEQKNIVLLDAGYWQTSLARSAFDLRMFAVAKILYSNNLFEKGRGRDEVCHSRFAWPDEESGCL